LRYSTKADKFFSAEERKRIRQTTADVESKTSGEIVLAVIDQSSRYPEAEALGGVILGSIISLILAEIFFHASLWSFIPLAFLFYFPSLFLIRKAPALKIRFAGKRRKNVAVRDRAVRTFYEKGLYRTKDGTGVLFFLSLLERKVWVLADRGIHGKIHQATLNKFASMVSKGIKEERACDALCEAIEGVGHLLAIHYPAGLENADELPDEVICGPGPKE
jgi:putative membrane protein